MRLLVAAGALALIAGVGAAQAQAQRLSDAQYIQAGRCAGLAEGAGQDAATFQTVLKDQSRGRDDFVRTRAEDEARTLPRQFRKADGQRRERFERELAECAALVG